MSIDSLYYVDKILYPEHSQHPMTYYHMTHHVITHLFDNSSHFFHYKSSLNKKQNVSHAPLNKQVLLTSSDHI